MIRSISEILAYANEFPTSQQRAQHLRENNNETLRAVLTGAFDPRIKWLLPETDPPYKPNALFDQENQLYSRHRQFYLFIEGGHPTIKQVKRELLFIQMLEAVCPDDAKLLCAMKNHSTPYPNITQDVVDLAFPGLLSA